MMMMMTRVPVTLSPWPEQELQEAMPPPNKPQTAIWRISIFYIFCTVWKKQKEYIWLETWVLRSLANCFPGFQVHVWKPSDYDYCDDHRVIIIIMLIAMIWTTSNYWKWFLPNEARFKWSSYSPLKVLNSGGGAKKSTVTVMHLLIQQHSQRSLIIILHHHLKVPPADGQLRFPGANV